jgi:hypothetical protein
MYGIVNKAIEELIIANFSPEKWQAIKKTSGIDIEYFISNEPYDDEITYQLAIAASKETGLTLSEVLINFGEWWILKTGKEKYGYLLESGGENYKDFLINLPMFHNRVMMIYPRLTPPEFKISNIEENSLHLHYYSKREGLQDFVKGLLLGLGKFYACEVNLTLLASRDDNSDHEIFQVSWE